MKTKINYLVTVVLFALFVFTSCQDEVSDIGNLDEQETIVPDSALANLMSNVVTNDGTVDDFLDNSSCFSLELPVTIIVADITIIIETEDDLEELEDLLDNVSVDGNIVDFIFPITLIFSDYSQLVIENEDQLQTFIDDCVEDENDAIECADFVYPISFSVFNSGFNLVDTVIIENDEALYVFLNELEEDDNALIVSLNFPVTIVYADGETIEVNTNEELTNAIEDAEQFCEDNAASCLEEDVALNLIECPWDVYLYTNEDVDNLDGPYLFTFSEDGTVFIEGTVSEGYSTTWELTATESGLELNIGTFYYYEAQYGNWLVVQCDDDELKFEHLTVDGTGLFFEQDCEDDLDCSITDISSMLQECPWDFTDAAGNYDNYQLIFNENGELQISEGMAASAIGGSWSLSATDNGLVLELSDLTAFQNDLGGEWLIIACDDDSNELTITQNNMVLELEQDCLGNLGCSVEDINATMLECAWLMQTNLLDSLVPIYMHFGNNSEIFIEGADNLESQIGTWNIETIEANIVINLEFQQGFEVLSGQWQIVECNPGNLYLVNGDNQITLEKACEVNNQNLLECYSIYVLSQECDDDNDGIATFVIETNSLQTTECIALYPLAGSYHPTYQDAVNTTNHLNIQLTTPTELSSQSIFFRVFNQDTHEYAVQELELVVEPCNEEVFNCFGDFEIVECYQPNNVPVFNLSANTIGLVDCQYAFTPSFHETLADAENDINPIANPEAYGTLVTQAYLRIEAESGNFEIFTIYLNTEDCNYFECFENAVVDICDDEDGINDGFALFNLENIYANCSQDNVLVTYHISIADAEAAVDGLVSPFVNTSNPQIIYARAELFDNSDIYEIFTVELIVNDCSANDFECFQSFDAVLETCYTDATVLYEFNLPLAFANCTPNADVVTYHVTQADANANMNAISNPESYNTAELNSLVYTRVEINNQVEIFVIQLNVVDCNSGSCTEEDIDGILTECQWNITSYNGSDNLFSYNFDFEENSGIVVIYNDTITIDASWSTSQPNDGVIIEFSNVAGPNIQAINGSWLVVECTAEQLVLHNVNDSNNEIVLDRTCE
ncbi:hypothetical protein HNV10_16415 [Winogradskyella litoriviva]|uniref:Uncharacterized protein n=1 Tax=Winogradskyella litoriviva TaxID=1220182 RepID=A0ABX2E8I7_9FLAO|nr:hypothetical protein [Winogradskyella litoriviva]NRD24839.1 hypothetical protein [Winogradskyella litoriviva]